MALLHVRSFNRPHEEGDEKVYLAVAESTGWDLSNYSTRDDPEVSTYPYSIYRQELFHHPPLYTLVLKLGLSFGKPVFAGLIFQVMSMALLLVFARRVARLFELSDGLQSALYAALSLCPLLLFSTTRLHHDGLLAIFAFCAFTMFIEALNASSTRKAIAAGLLFVLALNVRYNAIALLPLIFVFQLFHLYRQSDDPAVMHTAVIRDLSQWKCFSIVAMLVLIFGLPHYYRVFATYGSLIPSSFITPDPNIEVWSEFTRRLHQRSRFQVSVYLIAIFPMLLTWFTGSHFRLVAAKVRERSWAPMYLMLAVSLFLVHMIMLHQQVRYFAVVTPFMFVWFVLQIQAADDRARSFLWKTAAFTLFLMSLGGFASAIFRPTIAQVVPSLISLLPFLNRYYF
jgi:hypothetical protein